MYNPRIGHTATQNTAGTQALTGMSVPTEMLQQGKSEYRFPSHRRDIHGIGFDHSQRFPGRNFNKVEFDGASKSVHDSSKLETLVHSFFGAVGQRPGEDFATAAKVFKKDSELYTDKSAFKSLRAVYDPKLGKEAERYMSVRRHQVFKKDVYYTPSAL